MQLLLLLDAPLWVLLLPSASAMLHAAWLHAVVCVGNLFSFGFSRSNGKITREFATALRKHGLSAYHGGDAECQPGRSGDLWLHETTVSWIRERMKRSQPPEPWAESEEELGKRLKAAAEHCTAHHDVAGLCKEFPSRMRSLVDVQQGDRLRK